MLSVQTVKNVVTHKQFPITPQLHLLHWLLIKCRIKFDICLMTLKVFHCSLLILHAINFALDQCYYINSCCSLHKTVEFLSILGGWSNALEFIALLCLFYEFLA